MYSDKIEQLIAKKNKEKIVMLTCYDYSFAHILNETAIDAVLVGDSLANVVLGLDRTKSLSFREMHAHTKAVSRAVHRALVIADMPYCAYQRNPGKAYEYARKLIDDAGAHAVKLEWFSRCPQVAEQLVRKQIPVMGHIGLTPQTVDKLGGFKVQGKDLQSARRLKEQARILEDLGVFAIVFECIPQEVTQTLTRAVKIPTIGIGSGKWCDGQILVLYDLLGIYPGRRPKFVKTFENLDVRIQQAVAEYVKEVKGLSFPGEEHSFLLNPEILQKIQKYL
ncbi:MAG: 3-methyl-2-oxobutanoate hydroxymethyltransferase [Candidatus Omnitrophica bacterium]|nr:3-methyl-2-oxobutanoate hydroxymethyltransferase [Candidatus Omnitrophota bacterium]